MSLSPTTILVTTINIAAVLLVLYWARFLVKHIRENTEFADLLLQHERVEAETKPLGVWRGSGSGGEQRDRGLGRWGMRAGGGEEGRSGSRGRGRVLRNIDVWKRAKYEGWGQGEGPGQKLKSKLNGQDAVTGAEDTVHGSGDGVRQRRGVAFSGI